MANTSLFYPAGGALPPDAPGYVERAADDALFRLARAGEFCYILTPRQMGKSSLTVRTARRLRAEGAAVAVVDLAAVGAERGKGAADRWYYGIAEAIIDDLGLTADLDAWWEQKAKLPPAQRLIRFFRDVVLAGTHGTVTVFVDEIDSTLGLPFANDFFAAVRACYNRRAQEPDFRRLTFVLLGVASPSDLIADKRRTPFNVGQRIDLTDFTFEEARPLAAGLAADDDPAAGEPALRRVLHWTGGHPFLTQKLCALAVEPAADGQPVTEADVDRAVEGAFLAPGAERNESNLRFVRDRLTTDPRKVRRLLALYRRVRRGAVVKDDPLSPYHTELKLSGVVKARPDGQLAVRNGVYERVFTDEWARDVTPGDTTSRTSLYEWARGVTPGDTTSRTSLFYPAGGALPPDAPGYVERAADDALFRLARAGEFCYILTPRQMGKSSLTARTARRLRDEGAAVAVIDLTAVGAERGKGAADRWYYGVAEAIIDDLGLTADLDAWWEQKSKLPPAQRLIRFFCDVVLAGTHGTVTVFVDEIDSTLGLPFADDFFAAVRVCYNRRAQEPDFRRLTFVLLGVASPSDLIADKRRTPFNVGQRIDLTDFTFEEARPLAAGLAADDDPAAGEPALHRVLHWTGGHPFLTQKLCALAVEPAADGQPVTEADVDRAVEGAFLAPGAERNESNLRFVRDRLTTDPRKVRRLLALYRRVRRGAVVKDDPLSPYHLSITHNFLST